MATIMKSEVFFFITAIAVVLITIVFFVVLYHLIKILRDVEDISHTAKVETHHIAHDIESVRKSAKHEGRKFKKLGNFFTGWLKK